MACHSHDSLSIFLRKVSYNPGWPCTVAKADLELLIFYAFPSQVLGLQVSDAMATLFLFFLKGS